MCTLLNQLTSAALRFSQEHDCPHDISSESLQQLVRCMWDQLSPSQRIDVLRNEETQRLTRASEAIAAKELANSYLTEIAAMERRIRLSHCCTFAEGLEGHYWLVDEGPGPGMFPSRIDAIVNAFELLTPNEHRSVTFSFTPRELYM